MCRLLRRQQSTFVVSYTAEKSFFADKGVERTLPMFWGSANRCNSCCVIFTSVDPTRIHRRRLEFAQETAPRPVGRKQRPAPLTCNRENVRFVDCIRTTRRIFSVVPENDVISDHAQKEHYSVAHNLREILLTNSNMYFFAIGNFRKSKYRALPLVSAGLDGLCDVRRFPTIVYDSSDSQNQT